MSGISIGRVRGLFGRFSGTLMLSGVQAAVLCISLLSQVSLARHFGASHDLDKFYAVLGVATGVLGSLGVGINYVLPPKLVRFVVAGDEHEASLHAGRALLTLGVAILLIAVIGASIMLVVAENSPISEASGSMIGAVAAGWGIAAGTAMATILAAIATAHRRIAVPLCVSALPPFCLLLSVLFHPHPSATPVLAGMLVGTILQCMALALHARAFIRIEAPWFDVGRSDLAGLAMATFGAVCFSGYALIDAMLAPQMGAGILTLQSLSQRLVIAFGAVLTAGAFALAPADFGRQIEHGKHDEAGRGLNRTAATLIGVSLAAAVFTPILGKPILYLLFVGGSFGADQVDAMSLTLSLLLTGAGAMLATAIGFRLLYAMGSGQLVALASIVWLVSYAGLASLFWRLGMGNPLSISYAASWWLVFALMMILVHNRLRQAAQR